MKSDSFQMIDIIELLENCFENIIVYNNKGILLYACHKFWQDTGLSPDEFEGKGIAEITALDIYRPYAAGLAFETGEKSTVVQRTFMNEIAVATALPILNKQGETVLILSYSENNGQIAELETRLAEANRYIEEKNTEIANLLNTMFQDAKCETSPGVLKVQKLIERIVNCDANILLLGETGVGKTMYAKKIHNNSPRKDRQFIEINCAAIPEALLESELFGYDKGAFTGASEKGKRGQIELADGGTLFLDEISELNINLQSKLLKVIQDKEVQPIGGTRSKKINFRLITASNKDLNELVEKGEFRRDLYYRLNVVPIHIPALRDRKEDIHPLAKTFLDGFNKKYGEQKTLDRRVIHCLNNYAWPGNVRELENVIERMVLIADGNEITLNDLPPNISIERPAEIDEPGSLQRFLDGMEQEILEKAYTEFDGNISLIARKLGLTRQSVLRRLKKYSLAGRTNIQG